MNVRNDEAPLVRHIALKNVKREFWKKVMILQQCFCDNVTKLGNQILLKISFDVFFKDYFKKPSAVKHKIKNVFRMFVDFRVMPVKVSLV